MAHLKKRGKKYYVWFYEDGTQRCVNLGTGDYREAVRKQREIEAELILAKKRKDEERERHRSRGMP